MATHEDSLYGVKRITKHYKDQEVYSNLSQFLVQLIKDSDKEAMTIFCIGTDRSTGDSLAPLIGTMLTKDYNLDVDIWGTLHEPVHATNIDTYIERINPDSMVIVIDAALGKHENIGNITISNGKLKPGAGVNKNLPEVGDISICGVVNMDSNSLYINFKTLSNTRLSIVWQMAETITNSIVDAIQYVSQTDSNSERLLQTV